MTDTECFYRSTAADVLAAWEDTQRRYREVHAAIGAFTKRFDRKARVFTGTNYRIACLDGSKPEGPWRLADRGGWVPHRGSNAGKALGKEFDALRADGLGVLPGMPDTVVSESHRWLSPAVFAHDGAVWVHWSCDFAEVEESGWGRYRFDASKWQRAKASDYHLAREALADADAKQASAQ